MEVFYLTVLVFIGVELSLVPAQSTYQCGKCQIKKCADLRFCTGQVVKDHCNCCSVCSSDLYQPHPRHPPVKKKGNACEEVRCPRLKVCMENMQGLPLCMCPSIYICRRRTKKVCGNDDKTYDSRCHMRVAACDMGKRVKLLYKGPCRSDVQGTPRGQVSDVSSSYGYSNINTHTDRDRKQDSRIVKNRRKKTTKRSRRKRRHRNKRYRYLRGRKDRYSKYL
ncbi:hypothetical protein ScPMuIL_014977 [Solemya velum]